MKIPVAINIMDIEFFLPMLSGSIDGYYKVNKVYFSTRKGQTCLKLKPSTYISLGDSKVRIYSRMRPGKLIFYDLMTKLYRRRDVAERQQLFFMGWHCLTVWECRLKPKVRRRTLEALEQTLRRLYLYLEDRKIKSYETAPEDYAMVAEPEVEYPADE